MIRSFKERREQEEGFTLIELMVVVLIIAILLAIAIPTFLGAQNRAKDRAAQSNLRNALTAAKTLATDKEGLFQNSAGTAIVEADLTAVEPSLRFVDGTTAVGEIDVVVENSAGNITLVTKSGSGEFFCISSTQQGAVTYDRAAAAADIDAAADCNATKW